MIITPYDTKACMGYIPSLGRLADSIKKAYLFGGGFKHIAWDQQSQTNATVLQPDYNGVIKPFGHPVEVELVGREKLLVADGRSMFSVDPSTGEVRPKVIMASALKWLEVRLQLQQLWQSPNFPLLQSTLDYPTMLYGKVFSEALAKKYGLEPVAIARCDMLFTYAFWCFSHTEAQFKQSNKDDLGHLLAMTIKSNGLDITNVIANLDFFYSLDDVVKALQDEEVVGTQRMLNITVATLFEIARTTWYIDAGAPSSEIAACALEHPPTWMACVYLSVSNQSMKNSIATVAERYKRLKSPEQYINSIIHILGDK